MRHFKIFWLHHPNTMLSQTHTRVIYTTSRHFFFKHALHSALWHSLHYLVPLLPCLLAQTCFLISSYKLTHTYTPPEKHSKYCRATFGIAHSSHSVLILRLSSLSLHIHHAVILFSASGGSPFQLIKSDAYPPSVEKGGERVRRLLMFLHKH